MKIYNSLTRKKEMFKPLKDKEVKMYVCGITPYDTTHLGHAFTYVFFDVLRRYLEFKGYKVIYTQNVTDIDDDILKKAREEKKNWQDLGKFWTKRFLQNMESLNVLPPTHYVKATDSITIMIPIIEVLMKKSFAYENNGNVYFDIKKFKKYGKLSRLNQKQMLLIAQERGGNPDDPLKKNPLDFLLWQKSKENEPSWQSPWARPLTPASPLAEQSEAARERSDGEQGKGRPCWHIECSSMIKQYLGEKIDIHGGGRDLIYPHHESEIAQSESFTGNKPFVKYWLHTAMLLYEGEKMSKSLGNLVMVSDLLKKYSGNAIHYVLLSHHYRSPWEFHIEELDKAQKMVDNFGKILPKSLNDTHIANLPHQFTSFMDDDLNIPDALNSLSQIKDKFALKNCLSILGFNFFYKVEP